MIIKFSEMHDEPLYAIMYYKEEFVFQSYVCIVIMFEGKSYSPIDIH